MLVAGLVSGKLDATKLIAREVGDSRPFCFAFGREI